MFGKRTRDIAHLQVDSTTHFERQQCVVSFRLQHETKPLKHCRCKSLCITGMAINLDADRPKHHGARCTPESVEHRSRRHEVKATNCHGGQMRPWSCRRTRRNQNAVIPLQAEGDRPTAAGGQYLQATSAQFISDSAAYDAESGDDLRADLGVGKTEQKRQHDLLFRERQASNSAWFQAEEYETPSEHACLAPCCNLMWAYQPQSTRQSASLCAKEFPHTNLRRPSAQ